MADQKIEVGAVLRLDTAQSLENVGKIRQALKEAKLAVFEAQKEFGPLSAEAMNAAKYAADLADRIQEAAEVTDLFDPGKKFQTIANATSAIAGGFSAVQGAMGLIGTESEELEKQMMRLQSAMALSQGLSTVADSAKDFQRLGAIIKDHVAGAFSTLRAAIASTGILALVAILGVVAANWEKISRLISGVTEEQEAALNAAQQDVKAQQEKLDALDSQDNILRLQGKSEREILQLKIRQAGAVIQSMEAQVKAQQEVVKTQIEAERRNKAILQGILAFVTAPLQVVIDAVNEVASFFGKDWDFNIADKLAGLVFDDKQVEEEGKAAIAEMEKKLLEIKDKRAGMQLQIQKIDKEAADKRLAAQKESLQKEVEAEREALKLIEQLRRETSEAQAKEGKDADLFRLQEQYNAHATVLRKGNQSLLALDEWYKAQRGKITQQYIDEEIKALAEKTQRETEQQRAVEQAAQDAHHRRFASLVTAIQSTKDYEALTFQERISLLQSSEAQMLASSDWTDSEKTRLAKEYADARINIEQQEQAAKAELVNQGLNFLNAASELIGQQTALGKSMAVAETTISTYAAAQKAYQSQLIPGDPTSPIRAAIAAGAAIISGVARVKGILAVQVPKGGGVAAPSISNVNAPLAPQSPNNAVTTLDRNSINAIGNQAIKAFVVESDVTNNQERISRINRAARIG